jgi:hypothetical protein
MPFKGIVSCAEKKSVMLKKGCCAEKTGNCAEEMLSPPLFT